MRDRESVRGGEGGSLESLTPPPCFLLWVSLHETVKLRIDEREAAKLVPNVGNDELIGRR